MNIRKAVIGGAAIAGTAVMLAACGSTGTGSSAAGKQFMSGSNTGSPMTPDVTVMGTTSHHYVIKNLQPNGKPWTLHYNVQVPNGSGYFQVYVGQQTGTNPVQEVDVVNQNKSGTVTLSDGAQTNGTVLVEVLTSNDEPVTWQVTGTQ